jgi:hypothetical protein
MAGQMIWEMSRFVEIAVPEFGEGEGIKPSCVGSKRSQVHTSTNKSGRVSSSAQLLIFKLST